VRVEGKQKTKQKQQKAAKNSKKQFVWKQKSEN